MTLPRNLRPEAWVPDPAVTVHHERSALAAPDELWAAANSVRLRDVRSLGRLIRWRIPGTPGGLEFGELFRRYPFSVLEEGEDFLLSGLVGKIWTLARDYPRLGDPQEFRDWDRPGTVRVLFATWVEADGDESVLYSEARVDPVDRAARTRLRTLWSVIGPFKGLGAEPLKLAARRAEGR